MYKVLLKGLPFRGFVLAYAADAANAQASDAQAVDAQASERYQHIHL
jgi:hypothetical protein